MIKVEDDMLCLPIPSLILLLGKQTTFTPTWSIPATRRGDDYICIKKPNGSAIIRVGRGWGRNGRDSYFLFTPPNKLSKLVKKSIKTFSKTWIVCVEERDESWKKCFMVKDGRIVLIPDDELYEVMYSYR